MDIDGFIAGLEKLSHETGVVLRGTCGLVSVSDLVSFAYSKTDVLHMAGGVTDKTGPFVVSSVERPKVIHEFDRGAVPYVSSDYSAYSCPITGEVVEGRAAHRENLKKHGCRIVEKGEREHAEKRRRESLDRTCSEMAEKIVMEAANRYTN